MLGLSQWGGAFFALLIPQWNYQWELPMEFNANSMQNYGDSLLNILII
jgi:hypothetical protein